MTTPRILVPYNFTMIDEKALAFVIETYARHPDASVTLFHAYTPLPDLDVTANPEIKKTMSGLNYLKNELAEKEKGLEAIRQRFLDSGFAEGKVDYVFKKKSKSHTDEIVAVAKEGRYGVLVLGRKPGMVSQLFSRNVHERLLSMLPGIVVCIAN
jgi:hypothetical protein